MPFELRGVCPLLQVFDMPASVALYRDALGFGVVESAPVGPDVPDRFGWVWLRRDGADIMLNSAYDLDEARPGHAAASRVTAHEDTALYFECAGVDAAYEQLRACGIACDPPSVAPYGMKQLYAKDPDGFTICFQSREVPLRRTGSRGGEAGTVAASVDGA